MMHTGIDLSRYSDEDLLVILGIFEHELEFKEIGGKLVAVWKQGGPDRVREQAREKARKGARA